MNNDQTARSAGRLATAIAIPVALVTGFFVFQVLKPAPAATPEPAKTPGPMSTAPVQLAPLALGPHEAAVCEGLVTTLPDTLRGYPRRVVTGAPQQHAVFGDPAVTLSCGVAHPSFDLTDFVYPLNGVCWHPDVTGTVWTTVDRAVPVSLTLPAEQSGEGSAQWPAAVSAAIAAAVPASASKPGGCA